MADDQARATVRRWVEGINSGDIDAAIAVLAPDYVAHLTGTPGPVQGPEAFKQMYMGFIRPAFPDQKVTILQIMSQGNNVAVQTEWTATHRGTFMGVPATGKTVRVPGTGIFRINDGRIVEEWMQEDLLGLWQQLQPPPAQETKS